MSLQPVSVNGLSLTGADAGNYALSGQSAAQARILPRALRISGSVAQDKAYDGSTRAIVVPGRLIDLVAGESLALNASGIFEDPEIGFGKAVAVTYRLGDTATGLAGDYNLDGEILRASIVAPSGLNPVQPAQMPAASGAESKVVFVRTSPAVATLADDVGQAQCSMLATDSCECRETQYQQVDYCLVPGKPAPQAELFIKTD